MPYRFIRTGKSPVNQIIQYDDGTSSTTILRNCFALCNRQIKHQLDKWIESAEPTIKFEFDDHNVEIQRL